MVGPVLLAAAAELDLAAPVLLEETTDVQEPSTHESNSAHSS